MGGRNDNISYHFKYMDRCNMCTAPVQHSKVMGIRLNVSQGLKPRKVYGIGVSVMKCVECGLIYSNPQPIPFNINDHYGVDPEEYWAGKYFSGEEARHDLSPHHPKKAP